MFSFEEYLKAYVSGDDNFGTESSNMGFLILI